MALMGSAAMVVSYGLDAGDEARHDDWHSHEHLQERVSIPGFLRGRRYVATGAGRRCLVFYEVESLAVLTGDAYLERLNNPTPWSARSLALFRDTERTLCRTTVSVGQGVGGTLAWVPLSPQSSRADALREGIARSLPALVTQRGLVAAHLLEGDAAASRVETRERAIRGNTDAVADWLLLVEGYEPVSAVFESGPLARDALLAMGAASVGNAAGYALAALLGRDDL